MINKQKDAKVEEIELLNILTNKDAEKIIEKQIKDQIIVFSDENTSGNAKTEEQNCKMFLSEINNFQMTEIASDYHKSIDLLMTQYAKHTLIDLIASSNLEILIPMILKDSAA